MSAVIAATKSELQGPVGLDRATTKQLGVVFTGMGKQSVIQSLTELPSSARKEPLVMVGFAGVLNPQIQEGDVYWVRAVSTAELDYEPRYSLKTLPETLRKNTLIHGECKMLSLDRLVSEPREKRNLSQRYEADMVDMETYWVARFANDHQIPLIGLRVALDGRDQLLPPSRCYRDGSTELDWGEFIPWLLRAPSRLIDMGRLGKNHLVARRNLVQGLHAVMGEVKSRPPCSTKS